MGSRDRRRKLAPRGVPGRGSRHRGRRHCASHRRRGRGCQRSEQDLPKSRGGVVGVGGVRDHRPPEAATRPGERAAARCRPGPTRPRCARLSRLADAYVDSLGENASLTESIAVAGGRFRQAAEAGSAEGRALSLRAALTRPLPRTSLLAAYRAITPSEVATLVRALATQGLLSGTLAATLNADLEALRVAAPAGRSGARRRLSDAAARAPGRPGALLKTAILPPLG